MNLQTLSKKIRNERLRELRRVVEQAPEERFRMANFKKRVSCGTARCAAGWAALDPFFISQGLHWGFAIKGRRDHTIKFGDHYDLPALEAFFDLDEDDNENLFTEGDYDEDINGPVPKEMVIANIDRLLKGEITNPYSPV